MFQGWSDVFVVMKDDVEIVTGPIFEFRLLSRRRTSTVFACLFTVFRHRRSARHFNK